MLSFPNAKINLGLFVTDKRTDGFHNIQSVFYPINFNDILEFVENKSANIANKLNLTISGHEIEGNIEDNLCVKAYRILDSKYNLPPINIHLHKNIPLGAGLGGGSSDGTHMLLSLNKYFNLKISEEVLLKMALQLGSDCPFFLNNNILKVSGKGEIFHEIKNSISGFYVILIAPQIHISTKEAYKNVKLLLPKIPFEDIMQLPLRKWNDLLVNCFESYAFMKYPVMKNIKDKLYEEGAMYSSMTGSGSTIYGIFDFKLDLSEIFKKEIIWEGYL